MDAVAGPAEAERTPLARRLTRVAAWLGGTALLVFAAVLVSWVFGWTGGRELIESSYREAKAKSRAMRERHR